MSKTTNLKTLLIQKNKNDILEEGYKILETTRQSVQSDIEDITKWLKSQPHLPEITSPEVIENFLKMTKFSKELAKQKIDMYYSVRTMIPEIFLNNHPLSPHIKEMSKVAYCLPLPKLTKDLHRVTVGKFRDVDPDKFDLFKFFAYYFNIAEVRLWDDVNISNIMVCDLTGITFRHVLKFTPGSLMKCNVVSEKVYSSRISKLHFINCPEATETFIRILKQVMSPKLRDRFVIHKNLESLKEYIPNHILPSDYGGEELSLEELNELWQLKFEEHKDRFDKLETLKVNEQLRPVPLKNDEVLGFYGNFKKLDVD